jgi:hypothetical protein
MVAVFCRLPPPARHRPPTQVNRVKQWTRPDVAVIAGSNATRQSPAVAEGQRSALSPRAAYNRMLGGQACMIAERSA